MKIIRRISSAAAVCLFLAAISFFCGLRAYAYDAITARIPVSVHFAENGSTHIYYIRIQPEDDISPMPDSDTLSLDSNSTGYFEVTVTEPGSYLYRIYELEGDDTQIRYDSSIYHVLLFVENSDDGGLMYTIVSSEDGSEGKPDEIGFEDEVITDDDSSQGTSGSGIDPDDSVDPETVSGNDSSDASYEDQSSAAGDSSSSASAASSSSSAGAGTSDTSVTDPHSGSGGNGSNPVTGFFRSIFADNSLTARAARTTVLALILIAVSAFLFRRDRNEEDNNEN